MLRQIFLSLVVALVIIVAIHLILGNMLVSWNKSQLNELTERSILRMELAADRAVSTIADIHISGLNKCSRGTIEAYRKLIFSVASIKDIRLWDGQQSCAGFNADTVATDLAADSAWESARNPTLQFSASDSADSSRFNIRWTAEEFDIVAVLNSGGLLEDIIPAALRESLSVKVVLNNGRKIASYTPDKPSSGIPAEWEPDFMVSASSERYPITAYAHIPSNILWSWHNFLSLNLEILITLSSIFIGFLTSRVVFGPPDPVNEIDRALVNGEFVPFYQPIFALNSGAMVGFEMLARWKRKNGAMVMPAKFIPLVENFGRVDPLTFSLLRQARHDIVPLLQKDRSLKFTFNVTTDQFLSPIFFIDLQEILIVGKFPLECVVLEITERQQILDLDLARKMVSRYAAKGIRVAIDDAGTGHNGLSSIQTLEAEILKLDKFFIDGIVENQKSRQMVELLCQLAKQYNMAVVAEGIETSEQAAVALAMGIHEAQGFYFSRPVPIAQLLEQMTSDTVKRAVSATPRLLEPPPCAALPELELVKAG
uniref:EAL domain-containing protein n=1 Tax=Pararhizobium sp. IMCC3301 TaxID=3067904 RepID=UPI002741E54F|nr:EAL domain-containing protein [Pararhizobium sp. IMCC3301]